MPYIPEKVIRRKLFPFRLNRNFFPRKKEKFAFAFANAACVFDLRYANLYTLFSTGFIDGDADVAALLPPFTHSIRLYASSNIYESYISVER